MSEPFDAIRNMDRLVHDPSRLANLTALGACRSADFMYLQALTGLSKGNLPASREARSAWTGRDREDREDVDAQDTADGGAIDEGRQNRDPDALAPSREHPKHRDAVDDAKGCG